MAIQLAIRERRMQSGLSQEQLAALTNVSLRTIQRLEDGSADSINFVFLDQLGKALNCCPGSLFRSVEPERLPPLQRIRWEDSEHRRIKSIRARSRQVREFRGIAIA